MLSFETSGAPVTTEVHVDESLGLATEETLRMIDDRLHDTLLEAFSHRVDPIVRVLHWPSFQEKCIQFRQRRRSQMQLSTGSSYTGAYVQETQFSAPQPSPFSTSGIPAMGSEKKGITGSDRAFSTLLCAVYYASIISIVHGPNPSDLAQNINAVGLWSSLRREMTSRLNIMDETFVQAASIEFLQAMVIYLVSIPTSLPMKSC